MEEAMQLVKRHLDPAEMFVTDWRVRIPIPFIAPALY